MSSLKRAFFPVKLFSWQRLEVPRGCDAELPLVFHVSDEGVDGPYIRVVGRGLHGARREDRGVHLARNV